MRELNIRIRITAAPKVFLAFAVIFLLSALPASLSSESVTLTTYYPAPSGVYQQMMTTQNAYLATQAGGMVGIGTTAPSFNLDVNGSTRLQGSVQIPSGTPQKNYVLASSDANGTLTWENITAIITCKDIMAACTMASINGGSSLGVGQATNGPGCYATCPAGMQITGGGCDGSWATPPLVPMQFFESLDGSGANTYGCNYYNPNVPGAGAYSGKVYTHAVCCTVGYAG